MKLGFLRPLYERPGPWVSVYLDASCNTEDAGEAIGLRWRDIRRDLAGQGVDSATLGALEAAVRSPPRDGGHGFALFANRGETAMAAALPAPPVRDSATVAPLPHVVPMLAALGEPVRWVRVVVDRTGADLMWSSGWRPPRRRDVEGHEEWPLRRVDAGGWSQARFQRAAGVSWDRNAAEVAAAVAEAAERVDAEVLVVAGDPQARTLVVEHLPERWAPLVTAVEGSRAPGAKPDRLDEATAQAVRAAVARRRAVELDNFHARRASGRARSELDGVVTAARLGEIATLLLPAEGIEAPLWIGDAPTEVARAPDDLALDQVTPGGTSRGVRETRRGVRETRADTALIRAVAGTDGSVVFAEPGELPSGIGAVLRYAA